MPGNPGPRVSRAAWPCGAPCRALRMAVVVMCGTALCGTATASSDVHGPSGMSSVGTTGSAAAASGGVLSTAVATTELLGAPITAACNAHPLDNAGVSHCSALYYMHPLPWWNSCWHLSHLSHQWLPPGGTVWPRAWRPHSAAAPVHAHGAGLVLAPVVTANHLRV
jgi:hypothetical protein